MTPERIRTARSALGIRWGLGRDLRRAELGRALGFGPLDPGKPIRAYETGSASVHPCAAVALDMMLAGALPPCGLDGLGK